MMNLMIKNPMLMYFHFLEFIFIVLNKHAGLRWTRKGWVVYHNVSIGLCDQRVTLGLDFVMGSVPTSLPRSQKNLTRAGECRVRACVGRTHTDKNNSAPLHSSFHLSRWLAPP